MAVSEGDRLDLYEAVRDNWGERSAQTLMEYLPPIGWSDVARQGDVTALRADMTALRAELTALRADTAAGFADVRGEMRSGFAELRAEMRTEIADVRGEIADVRSEMATGLAGLRVEMHQGFNRQLVWLVTTVFGAVALVISVLAYLS